MKSVEAFLEANKIDYVLHEHIAVYTCQEAEQYRGDIQGLACKNLFLRDDKKRKFFLIVLPAYKRAMISELASLIGEKRLSFANELLLKEKLGLEPGSVTPFGLINDPDCNVGVYIDREVYEADMVSFHPNRNTATLDLSLEMFHKYLGLLKHEIHLIEN